jgi:hypothetical protein
MSESVAPGDAAKKCQYYAQFLNALE